MFSVLKPKLDIWSSKAWNCEICFCWKLLIEIRITQFSQIKPIGCCGVLRKVGTQCFPVQWGTRQRTSVLLWSGNIHLLWYTLMFGRGN